MFDLNEHTKFYMCMFPMSMNKGIQGLSNLIMMETNFSPVSGAAYVFFSRDRKQVKILRWDIDGFVLYQKRLAKGKFRVPQFFDTSKGCVELNWETFFMIMRGIRFTTISYDKRFQIKTASGMEI